MLESFSNIIIIILHEIITFQYQILTMHVFRLGRFFFTNMASETTENSIGTGSLRSFPMHVVRYESLKTNLREELSKLIQFLGLEVKEEQLDCVVNNPEGTFHRAQRKTPFAIKFTDDMRENLENIASELEQLLKNKNGIS